MSPIDRNPEKCSAVSTMERAMPDFDYSHLVKQLKDLMLVEIRENPDLYSPEDKLRVKHDDWFIARYLLRVKLNVDSAHTMLKKAMEFRNSPLIQVHEFPEEFYRIGAVFDYEPDRKGNIPVVMRIRLNQKIPLVTRFLKAFLFKIIEKADQRANGKGIVLLFDLQGAGIGNVDMELLYFVTTTLVSYFPKGLSYMLVHELPWILRSCWSIARQWLSEDHKDLVKFSDSKTIYEYFTEENLPDFLGGSCKRNYREVPDKCISITDAAKKWDLNEEECFRIRKKFEPYLVAEAN